MLKIFFPYFEVLDSFLSQIRIKLFDNNVSYLLENKNESLDNC